MKLNLIVNKWIALGMAAFLAITTASVALAAAVKTSSGEAQLQENVRNLLDKSQKDYRCNLEIVPEQGWSWSSSQDIKVQASSLSLAAEIALTGFEFENPKSPLEWIRAKVDGKFYIVRNIICKQINKAESI